MNACETYIHDLQDHSQFNKVPPQFLWHSVPPPDLPFIINLNKQLQRHNDEQLGRYISKAFDY